MEQTRDQLKVSAANSEPLTTYRRKVYNRAVLLGMIAALTMVPAHASAQTDPDSTPQYNLEVFAKPGNHRVLGGLEAVVPFMRSSNSMPFLDLKGKIDDDDSHEINAALGFRTLTGSGNWMMGGFLSYDYRDTRYDNDYRWLTAGVEALSRNYDFRANYYHTNDDPEIIRYGHRGTFSGSSLLLSNSVVEEPMSGGDVEVGMLLPFSDTIESRAYFGGYHFDADHSDDVTSGRLRFEIRPRKNIIIGLEGSHDDVRGDQLFAEVRFSFGYKNEKGIRTLEERMVEPVHRDIDGPMVTPGDVTLPKLDPATGKRAVFTHLDNTNDNDPAQNGTAKHPYSSLANYYAADADKPNTTLVVHQGDGTTTGYDQTLTLRDGQTVWGQGFDNGLAIRGFGEADKYPHLTTKDGPVADDRIVIQLAQNNEVAGVALLPEEGGIGILGGDPKSLEHDSPANSGPSGAANFNIHDNTITSDLDDTTGVLISSMNGGSSNGRISDNHIAVSTPIVLKNTSTSGGTSTQDVAINGNTLSGTGIGFEGDDYGSGRYMGSIVLENSATGQGNTATQYVALNNNSIDSTSPATLFAMNSALSGSTATQHVTISGNTLASGRGGGIFAANRAMAMEYDYALAADTNAIVSAGPTNATQGLTISGNTINSGRNAIYAQNYSMLGGTAIQRTSVSNNVITSRGYVGIAATNYAFGGYGYSVGTETKANQSLLVTNNTITSNDDAILAYNVTMDGNATQQVKVSGNTITSANSGVVLYNYGYGGGSMEQKAIVSGNSIAAADSGLVATNYNEAIGSQTLEFTDNTIDSDRFGILMSNLATGSQVSTVEGNIITSERGGIIFQNSESGSQASMITGNTIDSGDNGIEIKDKDIGIQTITVSANTIRSDDNGVSIEQSGDTASRQSVSVLDNFVLGHDYSIFAVNSGSGYQQLTITGNSVGNENGEEAIHVINEGEGGQDTDISSNHTVPSND